jgi:hypothetical protein
MTLSTHHDFAIIAGTIFAGVASLALPLSAVEDGSVVADLVKSSAQIFVWMMTILSFVWAGRVATEVLIRSIPNSN